MTRMGRPQLLRCGNSLRPIRVIRAIRGKKMFMTLLLTNEDVEKALIPEDAITATEQVYRELEEGVALNRARSQVYLPVESNNNTGFRYLFKSQQGGSTWTSVCAFSISPE